MYSISCANPATCQESALTGHLGAFAEYESYNHETGNASQESSSGGEGNRDSSG